MGIFSIKEKPFDPLYFIKLMVKLILCTRFMLSAEGKPPLHISNTVNVVSVERNSLKVSLKASRLIKAGELTLTCGLTLACENSVVRGREGSQSV